MGKEARIALLLAATACLLAVMVDWAVEELNEQPGNPDDAGTRPSTDVPAGVVAVDEVTERTDPLP